jgi:hypothetical protein
LVRWGLLLRARVRLRCGRRVGGVGSRVGVVIHGRSRDVRWRRIAPAASAAALAAIFSLGPIIPFAAFAAVRSRVGGAGGGWRGCGGFLLEVARGRAFRRPLGARERGWGLARACASRWAVRTAVAEYIGARLFVPPERQQAAGLRFLQQVAEAAEAVGAFR